MSSRPLNHSLDPLNSQNCSANQEGSTELDMASDAPSHFFSDSIDFEGDSLTYPGIFNTPDEDIKVGGYQSTLPPSVSSTASEVSPYLSTTGQYVTTPRSLGQTPSMSYSEDSYNPLLCDPALLGSSEHILRDPHEPLTPASSARASITARSSISSIPQGESKSNIVARHTPPDSDEPPKKRRSSRKARASTADEEDDKRKKFLEKNRIAASKCRQKKKVFVSELEQTKTELERQNARLHLEFRSLLNEVSLVKNELMSHAGCKDHNINRWLEVEAQRFVQVSANRAGAANPFVPPMNHGRPGGLDSAYSFPDTDPRNSESRRGSMDYSHASSLMTSPVEDTFPALSTSPKLKQEPGMNMQDMVIFE